MPMMLLAPTYPDDGIEHPLNDRFHGQDYDAESGKYFNRYHIPSSVVHVSNLGGVYGS